MIVRNGTTNRSPSTDAESPPPHAWAIGICALASMSTALAAAWFRAHVVLIHSRCAPVVPIGHAHLNCLGRYTSPTGAVDGLRPLRDPAARATTAMATGDQVDARRTVRGD